MILPRDCWKVINETVDFNSGKQYQKVIGEYKQMLNKHSIRTTNYVLSELKIRNTIDLGSC